MCDKGLSAGDLLMSNTMVGRVATIGGNGSSPTSLEITGVLSCNGMMTFLGKMPDGKTQEVKLSLHAPRSETSDGHVIDMGKGVTLSIPEPIHG